MTFDLHESATNRRARSPAVPLGGSTLNDRLDEDTKLLQPGVCTHTHPDDTDAQAVVVWGEHTRTRTCTHKQETGTGTGINTGGDQRFPIILYHNLWEERKRHQEHEDGNRSSVPCCQEERIWTREK